MARRGAAPATSRAEGDSKMKSLGVVFTALALASSASAHARECAPPPHFPRSIASGTAYELDLGTTAGASEVRIEEARDSSFRTPDKTLTWQTGTPAPRFAHYTMNDQAVSYRVTAFNSTDPSFIPCTYTDSVTILGDETVRATYRRAIVPVVGSANGANGSHFITSMSLFNSYFPERLRGRLVFHPAGVAGNANDRSMPYDIPPNSQLDLGDVVTQFGAQGIGSLDIIPDENAPAWLPIADVHIMNLAVGGATFGMSVPQVRVADFAASGVVTINVQPVSRARTNVGVRTLENGGTLYMQVTDGRQTRTVERSFPGTYFAQMTVDDLVGFHVDTPALIRINSIGALVYGTQTDNITNDPRMRISFGELDEPDVFVGEFFR
jgi:hypothetical protein